MVVTIGKCKTMTSLFTILLLACFSYIGLCKAKSQLPNSIVEPHIEFTSGFNPIFVPTTDGKFTMFQNYFSVLCNNDYKYAVQFSISQIDPMPEDFHIWVEAQTEPKQLIIPAVSWNSPNTTMTNGYGVPFQGPMTFRIYGSAQLENYGKLQAGYHIGNLRIFLEPR